MPKDKFTKKELEELSVNERWDNKMKDKKATTKQKGKQNNYSFQSAYDWTVQHVSILIMAAGLFGYIYEQSDNNYVVVAVGAGFAYACIHGALGKR